VAKIKATRDSCIRKLGQQEGVVYLQERATSSARSRATAGEEQVRGGRDAYDFLFSRKVLVRHFPSDALTAPFLRISVGSDDEMLVLDQTLDAWLKAPPNA